MDLYAYGIIRRAGDLHFCDGTRNTVRVFNTLSILEVNGLRHRMGVIDQHL